MRDANSLRRFLQTLLPLLTCTVSLLLLLYKSTRLFCHPKRSIVYKPFNIEDTVGSEELDGDDDDSIAELTLQHTSSRTLTTVQDVDKPMGKEIWIFVEVLALLGQVIVSTIGALSTRASASFYPSFTEAATWSYILLLAILRLILPTKIWRLSSLKIWAHTAFLYMTQWICYVIRFRSVLVHSEQVTNLTRLLTIIGFAFSTVLLTTALLARKGNKTVLLEHERDLVPSHEPLASLLSLAMFGWVDAIVWRGYRKTLELGDVWDLSMRDKAATVLAEFRQIKKTHTLAIRLLLFFKRKLLIQGLWAMFSNLFTFLPTLLLKGILEHLEDPSATPASAAWLYVLLLFVSGVIKTVGDNQALWIGRRVCIQLRAIIIGEVYSKALRRRAAASVVTELGKENPNSTGISAAKKMKRKIFSIGRKKKAIGQNDTVAVNKAPPDAQANNGTIINLMSIDSFKVSEISAYLHFLWASVPVQITLAVVLVYRILGKSSLAGVGIMVFIMPLNFFIAKSFQRAQKKIMASTDARIHSTNEVLQNIRIIKYFAWEQRFSDQVSDKRRIELKALRNKYILWASAAMVWSGVPILTTFASFFVYTVVEKKSLIPSVAFPALSMFALLRVPLDQLADMIAHVQEAKVSVDRVEKFLNEEETEKYIQLRQTKLRSEGTPRIALEHANLSWNAGKESSIKGSATGAFRLIDMNVTFEIGRLNIIAGPTGSGKTSLLMALLGEMRLLDGHVHIPGGSIRQNLHQDPATGLTESVAFCAQQAWLVNDTIKENILFATPFDPHRYEKVIGACALERDMEILDAGDQTLVGEKGIALSGGQKQRISLARALYSSARHVFLDDCLSAVDSHTARHIFENAIEGDLMQNRTCILVTHNISLALPNSSYVVVLDNGKIAAQGSPSTVFESGALGEEILKSRPGSRGNSAAPSRVTSNLEEVTSKLSDAKNVPSGGANGRLDNKAAVGQDVKPAPSRTESKAEGSVKAATVKMYLRAMGAWYYWVLALTAFAATQAGSVATNIWIRQWANAYHTSEASAQNAVADLLQSPVGFGSNSFSGRPAIVMPHTTTRETSMLTVADDINVGYYLGIYALLGSAYVLICFSREILLFAGSLHASWHLHQRLLEAIMRAKFKFFDSTPLGQLINRFSKDIEAIDQEVSPVAMGMINCLASVITIVILISVITPGFLIAGFFVSCIYFAVGMFYIHSSRDLKRIESVQRSPLYQAFGETLSGIVTIRAYGDESRFICENHHRVNTHNRPFIYLWATNRWLAVRADLAGSLVAFSAGVFVMRSSGIIDPGAAGLSLSYAITFTEIVLWLVRLYGANEQNMNSVERVKEYLEVDQEARAHIPETKPAANWPSHGAVQFIAYTTRYRTDLGPVLKKVTFNVRAGEKVGIVGRTGAGKSSLALALFRGLEAEAGKILIDDVDIGLIGLQDLREAITIVPQDPTLFTGTLRSNLDPFGLFTDEEIFTALRRVQLISSIEQESDSPASESPAVSSATPTLNASSTVHTDTLGSELSDSTLVRLVSNVRENKNIFHDLSSSVSESGSNLSQGQRQLLCLARALLKSPRVLLMDEATASIDYATDAKIQDTLRELKDNTIITIAHRLQTIIDYDKVLVLEKGEVVEFDDPWELIRKEEGSFRALCETSGDFDTLFELAKKSFQYRRLVDDE
jgi:ABC-type multidrug transport system fused ATPase/permease subunit